jgi:NhaP-type Na+/H+ or K+/H+ antiporter
VASYRYLLDAVEFVKLPRPNEPAMTGWAAWRGPVPGVGAGLFNPKLLGGGMSPTALTWAFASSVAKSSGYMLTSANVIMVSGHGHGFSVQKNHALIRVLAGQGRNIYAELQ